MLRDEIIKDIKILLESNAVSDNFTNYDASRFPLHHEELVRDIGLSIKYNLNLDNLIVKWTDEELYEMVKIMFNFKLNAYSII